MIFDHFNISAPKELLAQVRDFYCELFELEVGQRPNFNFDGYWLYCQSQAVIHLTQSDAHSASNSLHYHDHIAFRMQNYQQFKTRLTRLKIDFKEQTVPGTNTIQLFFYDPADGKIEVLFR
ncbi:diguanylate cyclase [Thalassotalea sp. M1531]|uniref:Diguanylate cyclase n=1 Tax=Thalassotalea algicola TaxID=2716224 RepID=A0A7Y0Q5H0_9GAMM|nr:diguanylate cyclase [Thalassotalea algicola]NMP30096.1 diguanylate cyclase [Thalassotalea algicola]